MRVTTRRAAQDQRNVASRPAELQFGPDRPCDNARVRWEILGHAAIAQLDRSCGCVLELPLRRMLSGWKGKELLVCPMLEDPKQVRAHGRRPSQARTLARDAAPHAQRRPSNPVDSHPCHQDLHRRRSRWPPVLAALLLAARTVHSCRSNIDRDYSGDKLDSRIPQCGLRGDGCRFYERALQPA